MEIKIERGIPVPQIAAWRGKVNKTSILRKLFREMNVGDSILLTDQQYALFCQMLKTDKVYKRKVITARREGEKTIRVWRMHKVENDI